MILIDVREEDERLFEQIHSAVQGSAMHAGKAAHHCGQVRGSSTMWLRSKRLVSRNFWRVRSVVTATISAPSRQRPLNSRRGVLDRQALLRPNTQLASRQ